MSNIEDVMAGLSENAQRDIAAAAFLQRLTAFLGAEEARGYGIEAELDVVGSGALRVELDVHAPAGEVGGVDPVELVDADAPAAAKTPEPETGDAPQPDMPKSKPPRWTEDEDATAVRMAVAGAKAHEIAAELGRPVPGTGYRLRTVLKDRIDAAKGGAAPQAQDQPAPEPAPPSDDFTPEDDARLRRYMDDGLGIGGAAAVLQKPRDVVAARWAELQKADAA